MQIYALPKAEIIALCIKYAIHSNPLAYSYISLILTYMSRQFSIRTYIFLPSSIFYQRSKLIRFYYAEFSKNDTRKLMTKI